VKRDLHKRPDKIEERAIKETCSEKRYMFAGQVRGSFVEACQRNLTRVKRDLTRVKRDVQKKPTNSETRCVFAGQARGNFVAGWHGTCVARERARCAPRHPHV